MKKTDKRSLCLLVLGFFLGPVMLASPPESQIQAQSQGLAAPIWRQGPLSFGMTYDSLLGGVFNAQYAQAFNDRWAVGLIGEYGPNQYRLNGTLGTGVWQDAQVKFSGEYLSQVLPFNFASGNIQQRVGQSAYGLDLAQQFHQGFFQELQVGAYWAKAPSVSLPVTNFIQSGVSYANERHLAGSVSQGLNLGTAMALSPWTSLGAKLFYDQLRYHTEFTPASVNNQMGFGDALELKQVLTERINLSLKTEQRAIYNTYRGQIDWTPMTAKSLGMGVSAFVQHLASSNQMASDNTLGLAVSLSEIAGSSVETSSTQNTLNNNLLAWVKSPAVYMERVLVASEQTTDLLEPTLISVSPNNGLAVATTVILTGTHLTGTTAVSFGGTAATSILVIDDHTVQVITPGHGLGTVDVVVTTPNGSATLVGGFTYTCGASGHLLGACAR